MFVLLSILLLVLSKTEHVLRVREYLNNYVRSNCLYVQPVVLGVMATGCKLDCCTHVINRQATTISRRPLLTLLPLVFSERLGPTDFVMMRPVMMMMIK